MNLPSKKLFLVFMPVIVILGIFVLAKGPTVSSERPTTKAGPEVVAVQNSIINEIDTDKDGLKDWEETIWKTDPNNPRTHAEYSDDSAYVTAQLDLMKNSPGEYTGMGPIETSEDLGKQLFEEYLMLKQTGDVTSEDIARLTDRIRDNISTSNVETFYKTEQVKTFPSNDLQKLQRYADTMTETVNRYSSLYASQLENTNVMTSQLSVEFLELTADIYLKLSEAIIKIEVPEEILVEHVEYANSLKESSFGFLALGQKTDPLQSIIGLKRHTGGQEAQRQALDSITIFLNQSGIITFNVPLL